MPTSLPCHGCRHYAWGSLDSDRCTAFLEGIPDEIWLGTVTHDEPYPGDGGIRREPEDPGPAANLRRRHEAWSKRPLDRFGHETDPLGAIVANVDAAPLSARLDTPSMRDAWRDTHDAPAMLLVLLRARRADALARAVHLTSAQLDAEGCDYLDNKGWLGVGLCLGSYQTEGAFENVAAAWSALSAPFRDGYLTARVQQTLVRNLRRIVPAPPPAAEWASPEYEVEGVGPLNDAVVAMRLTQQNKAIRATDLALLEPWTAVTNAQGLEDELARELAPGHRLFGRPGLRAIARRTDRDDVLFVNDSLAAVVHLTWAKERDPAFPSAEVFASVDDWLAQRMNPDHDAFAGQSPRAFSFEFKSTLTLEEMLAGLPDHGRWEWTVRDSAWYGDYLWAKDGSTRVRIFAEDEAGRFAVQADLVDADAEGEHSAWFTGTRMLVVDTLLPAVNATDVVETTPEYD